MTISSQLLRVVGVALAATACVGEMTSGPGPLEPTGRTPEPSAPSPSQPGPAPATPPPVTTAPPVTATPAASTSPPATPAGAARGILGCPTIDPPAYGTPTAAALSRPYQASCATCHGGAGEGREKYPALPGNLTEADYVAKVRAGIREMPAFAAAFISDADLRADYAKLKQRALDPGALAPVGEHPSTWSTAKVEETYRAGLAVWRKPGAIDGQACTNCHSPDGVELAVIGFSDDSILRRAQQHVSPDDALVLRDFVHAQRRRLGISRPCSTDWRPFQPGGTVLAGNTPDEQDASFMSELGRRDLLLSTGKVVTLADAKRAWAELQAIDLRTLPMGIPLPRWSADKFNGPAHRDINDYMPVVPTIPNRPAELFAIEDEYLANPTDAGLYRLLDENRRNTNDGGYAAKNRVPNVAGSNCPVHPDSVSWILNEITRPKRQSVLIAAHLFREELKKPGSFARRPASPFPDAPAAFNAPFHLGAFNIEPPCYDNLNYPNWIRSFPPSFRDELPESDLAKGVVSNASDRVTHTWMTLGQVLDPTLIATDRVVSNVIHYWAFRNFAQKEVHLPFIYMHRLATQARYWKDMRTTALYPKVRGTFDVPGGDWLNPLLATEQQESAGLRSAIAPDSKKLPAAEVNRFKGNLIRTLMLLRRELLVAGAALQTEQNFDHCLAVTCQTQGMRGYVDGLKSFAATTAGKAAFTAQGFDLALYQEDTGRLIAEVLELMGKAPRRSR